MQDSRVGVVIVGRPSWGANVSEEVFPGFDARESVEQQNAKNQFGRSLRARPYNPPNNILARSIGHSEGIAKFIGLKGRIVCPRRVFTSNPLLIDCLSFGRVLPKSVKDFSGNDLFTTNIV
jgi:hypothetical protein